MHLDGHLQRLLDSCKIYRIDCPYSKEDLVEGCFEVVRANDLASCYIRPMVMRGYGATGMDGVGSPIETYIPAWEWGAYLGAEGFRDGIDCCTASYARPAPNTFPGMAKAAGNYSNAALIKMEAQANGYAEAIALDASSGMVSEGSGQNIFVVKVRDAVLNVQIDRQMPSCRHEVYLVQPHHHFAQSSLCQNYCSRFALTSNVNRDSIEWRICTGRCHHYTADQRV